MYVLVLRRIRFNAVALHDRVCLLRRETIELWRDFGGKRQYTCNGRYTYDNEKRALLQDAQDQLDRISNGSIESRRYWILYL